MKPRLVFASEWHSVWLDAHEKRQTFCGPAALVKLNSVAPSRAHGSQQQSQHPSAITCIDVNEYERKPSFTFETPLRDDFETDLKVWCLIILLMKT